jgi:membrane associated rhomboid family serine protease
MPPSAYTPEKMIPLRDVIPSRTTPVVTIALIALNALVFLYEQTLGDYPFRVFVATWGLVPAQFDVVSLFTSMFVHGGWAHFLGNMLYLWIFGDNVEDRVGHGRYVVFYLGCGAVAAVAQSTINAGSDVPMIGASGAISGVLGAYIVMFPHSRVLTLVPIFIIIEFIEIPAVVLLGLWFLMQLVSGVGSLGLQNVGGVAFWAHAAGFIAGVATIGLFRRPERQEVDWWDGAR